MTNPSKEIQIDKVLLHFDHDPKDLREALDLFNEHCPSMEGDIETALNQGDTKEATRALHSFAGALSNFFPATLVNRARELENLVSHEGAEPAKAKWDVLRPEVQSFLAALGRCVNELIKERA